MEEFYVTLYATSDVTDFSVETNRPLNFSGSEIWNVAVMEISLSSSLYNIKDDFIKIGKKKKSSRQLDLPDGVYPKYTDLYGTIRSLEPRIGKDFSYSRITVRPNRTLQVSKNLSEVLDIPSKIENSSSEETLTFTPKMRPVTKYISVLSNIVEERMLGEDMLPLLTSFAIDGNYLGGVTIIEPYPLEYVRVKPGVHKIVHFELKSADGAPVRFRDNFLLIRLKFARL